MDLLKLIGSREPEYDERYHSFILEYTIEQGGKIGTSSEEDKWLLGKFFSNQYEMYMYAAFLGLKKDYRIPFDQGTKKKKFWNIGNWKPVELTNYLIATTLGKLGISLFDLENLSENDLQKEVTAIKKALEEYANGGFDLIRAKSEEEGDFFKQNDMSFIELLDK